MRTLGTLLLLLAIPTFAAAQQADAADVADLAPVVELEQSTPSPAVSPATVSADAPTPDVEIQSRDIPAEQPAAMQEPGSNQWWYLVGAIVVGGLIIALLL